MRTVFFAIVVLLAALTLRAQAVEFVLTDASEGVNHTKFAKSDKDFSQFRSGSWSVQKLELYGGKQEGSELIVLNNGRLELAVSPTRGLNIVSLKVLGEEQFSLGWKSPVAEVVHPKFIDLESRGGLGWLDGFNEWMCRCGLEFAGHPGKDVFTTNTGDRGELTLTLHGKIGNTPASRVTFSVDEAPPHRLSLRGTVYERSFHGPKLRLETEISTVPGSSSVQVEDSVTNMGGGPQEFQLIYHTNYGNPILEAGAKIVGAFESLQPMNAHAATGIDRWNVCEGPTTNFVEQVYLAHAAGDANGKTSILLENAQGTKGASISWDVKELPYATIWKNFGAVVDGYVVGLEPGTGFSFNRWVERHFDRVPKLKAGQTRRFALSFDVQLDKKSVDQVRQRIETIQRLHPLTITPTPPTIPKFSGIDAEGG